MPLSAPRPVARLERRRTCAASLAMLGGAAPLRWLPIVRRLGSSIDPCGETAALCPPAAHPLPTRCPPRARFGPRVHARAHGHRRPAGAPRNAAGRQPAGRWLGAQPPARPSRRTAAANLNRRTSRRVRFSRRGPASAAHLRHVGDVRASCERFIGSVGPPAAHGRLIDAEQRATSGTRPMQAKDQPAVVSSPAGSAGRAGRYPFCVGVCARSGELTCSESCDRCRGRRCAAAHRCVRSPRTFGARIELRPGARTSRQASAGTDQVCASRFEVAQLRRSRVEGEVHASRR